MRRIIFFTLVLFVFFHCKNEEKSNTPTDPVMEKMGGKNYADLIRIPVKEDGSTDTTFVAKLQFDTQTIDLGSMKLGEKRNYEVRFKSTGKKDLYILSADSSCGCTVPSFSKDAIPPGQYGTIEISFDSTDRTPGKKEKTVVIKANTHPNVHELKILANVLE